MARPLRIEYSGAYYHVMNRGQSRRNIFIEDKGRKTFLDLLADMARLWKVQIYAYCLMDNHYHLLLSSRREFCLGGCAISMGSIPRSLTGSIITLGCCFAAGIKRSSLMRKSIFYRWSAIFIKTADKKEKADLNIPLEISSG
jgi:Transposase IS200 like